MSFIQDIDYRSPSIISLLILNLVVIIMAVAFKWDLFTIVFFFWIENLIIGVFNILRLGKAENLIPASGKLFGNKIKTSNEPFKLILGKFMPAMRVIFMGFFSVHYFGFCIGHGVFLITLLGAIVSGDHHITSSEIFYRTDWLEIGIGIAGMIISHAVSFKVNYIGKEEYKKASLIQLMFMPYRRIIWVHVFIILAVIALLVLRTAPVYLIIIFLLGKTVLDLFSHYREHKRLENQSIHSAN